MANVLDYLKWRKDLTFKQDSFNEVDALILARLSYIPFDGILSQNSMETISLSKAISIFLKDPDCKEKVLLSKDIDLIQELENSVRFSSLKLSFYVNQIELDKQKQFSALVISIHDRLHCVSFRGTDSTIVGWKEDFNMTFMTPVPSQVSAKIYLKEVMNSLKGKFILTGHSKGGNLAIYAGVENSKIIQKRILNIYNFDGPGFESDFFKKPSYLNIESIICTYIPQSSIVGMLLEHEENHQIVKSTNNGILQHDLYSWQVIQNTLIQSESLTKDSVLIDETVKEWVDSLDVMQRQQFIDSIYKLFESSQTLDELYKNTGKILSSIKNLSEEEKKNIGDILKLLLKSFIKNVRE